VKMFRIKLLWVGKTKESFIQEGILHYQKKLRPYLRLNFEEIPSSQHKKGGKNDSLREETQKILQRLKSTEQNIFLDEKGKGLTSIEFSSFLEQQINFGTSSMTFVIGGAYGFQKDLISDSSKKIRLSDMTMNHQMIRILFLEQLYRAFTIIRGESYHH
jgi:23S rRNA (pseudouridine1915-N3)-methyltransferase